MMTFKLYKCSLCKEEYYSNKEPYRLPEVAYEVCHVGRNYDYGICSNCESKLLRAILNGYAQSYTEKELMEKINNLAGVRSE